MLYNLISVENLDGHTVRNFSSRWNEIEEIGKIVEVSVLTWHLHKSFTKKWSLQTWNPLSTVQRLNFIFVF